MTTTQAPARPLPAGMSEMKVLLFIIGMFLAMGLAIVDQTIVSSALLPIIGDLAPVHGADQAPWLITGYMLAATASQPLYGKVSDIYGPRAGFLAALGFFGVGSLLCAMAQNMGELIAFRVVQGVGGGGLMGMAIVVLSTIYPPRERAAGSTAGGGVIALGIVLGPMIGGPVSSYASWRWIFWLNVPAVALIVLLTLISLRLPHVRKDERVDALGVLLIAGSTCGLLLCAKWITVADRPTGALLGAGAAGVLFGIAFVIRQATAAHPLLPPSLWHDPVFRVTAPLQFLGGFALLALPAFVVVELNVVYGVSAKTVALHLLPLAAGVLITFAVWGRVITKSGRCRPILVINTALGVLGTAGLALLPASAGLLPVYGCLVLIGLALGGVTQVALFATQAAAPPDRIGMATTSARFASALGSTFGSALVGTALSSAVDSDVAGNGVDGTDPGRLIAHLSTLDPERLRIVVDAFRSTAGIVFTVAAVTLGVALLLGLRMPDVRLDRADPAPDAPAQKVS